jgi:hypothetical protein
MLSSNALVLAGYSLLLGTISLAGAADMKCPVVFSGQIPTSTQLTDLDSTSSSPFNPGYVRASALPWSQIVLFPNISEPARFSNASYKPLEVTITEKSIFQSQNGFRRAGLQFSADANTNGQGTIGVRTLHWSVKQDPARKLNLTHEYLVWALLGTIDALSFSRCLLTRNSN